jgi:hypothetical protein
MHPSSSRSAISAHAVEPPFRAPARAVSGGGGAKPLGVLAPVDGGPTPFRAGRLHRGPPSRPRCTLPHTLPELAGRLSFFAPDSSLPPRASSVPVKSFCPRGASGIARATPASALPSLSPHRSSRNIVALARRSTGSPHASTPGRPRRGGRGRLTPLGLHSKRSPSFFRSCASITPPHSRGVARRPRARWSGTLLEPPTVRDHGRSHCRSRGLSS